MQKVPAVQNLRGWVFQLRGRESLSRALSSMLAGPNAPRNAGSPETQQ